MPLPRKGDSRLTIQPSLVWDNSDAQHIPQHHRYSTPTAAPPPRASSWWWLLEMRYLTQLINTIHTYQVTKLEIGNRYH